MKLIGKQKKKIEYVVKIVPLDDLVKDIYADYAFLDGYITLYSKGEKEGHMNWHGFKKPKKLLKILGMDNFVKLTQGQREFTIEE